MVELNAIGQKKTPSHSLAITRETHNGDREKSSGQAHLFNIGTKGAMDRTTAQPQVKLSLLRSNSSLRLLRWAASPPVSYPVVPYLFIHPLFQLLDPDCEARKKKGRKSWNLPRNKDRRNIRFTFYPMVSLMNFKL
jgi:hypothetical protein